MALTVVAVVVGGGGRGSSTSSRNGGGASGGDLRMDSALVVNYGETLTVDVGEPGHADVSHLFGDQSDIKRGVTTLLSAAGGGQGSNSGAPSAQHGTSSTIAGTITGGDGGKGGNGSTSSPTDRAGGGGGAGGYTGAGGAGGAAVGPNNGLNSTGGGGGGGGSSDGANKIGGMGGGVGLNGSGSNGIGGAGSAVDSGSPGTGGSGGGDGTAKGLSGQSGGRGGIYGGGGGGDENGSSCGNGGQGGVSITYVTADFPPCAGGTKTTNGANTIHTFTEIGANDFIVGAIVDVNSSLNLSESITMFTDIRDILPRTSSLSISESVNAFIFYPASVFDSIDISENIENTGQLRVIPYDTLSLSQNLLMFTDLYHLSTENNLGLTEYLAEEFFHNIDVVDSINISEETTVFLFFPLYAEDAIDLSDNFGKQMTSFVSVSDTIDLSEDITSVATLADFQVTDNLNLSENITTHQYFEFLTFDSVETTETTNFDTLYSVFITLERISVISIFYTVSNPILAGISVSNTINLSENYSDNLSLKVSVIEQLNIQAILTQNTAALNISVRNTLFTTERIFRSLFYSVDVNVEDNLSLSETTTFTGVLHAFTYSQINLLGIITVAYIFEASQHDDIAISELVTVESFRFSPIPGRRRPVAKIGWDS